MHPLDLVDELTDLQDTETSCIQDSFLIDGIEALSGAFAVLDGLEGPLLQFAKGGPQPLHGVADLVFTPASRANSFGNGREVVGYSLVDFGKTLIDPRSAGTVTL